MAAKPVVRKKNLAGNTVYKSTTKTTNRDYEGMPYGRETVTKSKLVRDKEGKLVRGKKVTFEEKSSGARVLGSRNVERFAPKKTSRRNSTKLNKAKDTFMANPYRYDAEKIKKAMDTGRGGKVLRVMRREMKSGKKPF